MIRSLVWVKQRISLLLYLTGVSACMNALLLSYHRNRVPLLVLCYHGIEAREAPLFEKQLDFLVRKGYRFLSGAQLAEWLGNPAPGEKGVGYACLTFDDCLVSNYTVVRPILAARRIPAIFFAVSAELDQPASWTGVNPPPRTMTAQQVHEMAEVFEVGAHTRHHVRLGTAARTVMEEEVAASKADLERITGKGVRYFAYPNGSYSPEAFPVLSASGYRAAFTIRQHLNYPGDHVYELGRYVPAVDRFLDFKMKVSGGYDWFHFVAKHLPRLAGVRS